MTCGQLMPVANLCKVQGGQRFAGGQQFANFCCTSFKTNISHDTEGAYSIEKCAICLDTFVRF